MGGAHRQTRRKVSPTMPHLVMVRGRVGAGVRVGVWGGVRIGVRVGLGLGLGLG